MVSCIHTLYCLLYSVFLFTQDLSTNEWKLPSDLLASDILDMQEFKDLKDLPIDLNTPSPSIFPPFSDDHVLDPSYIPTFSPISPAPNNSQDK